MRRASMIAAVLALLLGGQVVRHFTQSNPSDAPGCQGLADYRTAMFRAERDYLDDITEDGVPAGEEPVTYSSAAWHTIAEDTLSLQTALNAITPPPWAAGFHEVVIARERISEQISASVAEGGVTAGMPFLLE